MNNLNFLSRRSFLKMSAASLGSFLLTPRLNLWRLPPFPEADRLGRVTAGKIEIKARPDADSPTIGTLYEDAVVIWLREVSGKNLYRFNQRWVETPDGYIWSPYLQPVMYRPNVLIANLPVSSTGAGFWAEVSVPYVDLVMDNPPARSPGLKARLELGLSPRLYYSQVVWIDQIRIDEQGQTWYRINEKYGSYGDIFLGAGEAFRALTEEEIAPIHPEVENKHIRVDVSAQTLACFEDEREVFFTRISSGARWNAEGQLTDTWATPLGEFPIWRKLISLHMSGGTTGGGWDLPGVGWVSLFVGTGVAIHSTFWHNNWGEPTSRGCVNARPEDAKWVFRWTQPAVSVDPGDLTIPWPGGTRVKVIEG